MQVTITFDPSDEADRIQAALQFKASMNAFAPQQEQEPKAAKASKPADKPAPTPPATTESTEAADAPPPNLDIETVRAAIKEVQALDGKDAAIAILHKYGAKAMSELKPENYAAAYADAKANPKVKAARG